MNKWDVYEKLKSGIIDGTVAQGQWLVERELCEEYGISRTPVREVLFRLVSEGLVVQEPSKGFFVRNLTMDQVVEIFQAREALEVMAVALACQRMRPADLERLRKLREELVQVDIDKDIAVHVKLGRLMHNIIRDVAQNSLLKELYVKVDNLTHLTANLTVRSRRIEERSRASHLAIVDALLAQDADLAQERIRNHLRETCSLVVSEFFVGVMLPT
jgi:DNA-binding GntR family transcriptional regulator